MGMTPDMSLDMQQSWLREQMAPHVDRIASGKNPMAELARVAYEVVSRKMTAITNTEFGPGHLALVGGIQLNMPKGYPDYFLPCDFTIQSRSSSPKSIMDSLMRQSDHLEAECHRAPMYKEAHVHDATKDLTKEDAAALQVNFPGVLPGPVVHKRLTEALQGYGLWLPMWIALEGLRSPWQSLQELHISRL